MITMISIGSFTLSEEEVQKRKKFLEITPSDERRLTDAHSRLQTQRVVIIERFYEYLLAHQHTRDVLRERGLLERLKELQGKYFMRLTSGDYGLDYFENRLLVGQAHFRIGLSPEWYLGAYVKYLHIVSDVLSQAFGRDYEGFFQTLLSLTKVIYLDMGLALDAYHYSAQEGLESKNVDLEKANVELRRVQDAKRQLTDMIVHDLQNPLTGIRSVLQVLDAEPGTLSEDKRGAIKEALRRCDDLSQMILNVLQVSRAEQGELEPYIETVELSRLVQDVAQTYLPTAKAEDRILQVNATPPVTVRTDQALVRRILQNLIRNALRHTPRGTTIVISVEPTPEGPTRLSVLDDGPGIPPDIQELLFEPFGAAALRAAGRRVDTGLGLASCRVSAKALGTDIRVESDGNRGTTFSILFP